MRGSHRNRKGGFRDGRRQPTPQELAGATILGGGEAQPKDDPPEVKLLYSCRRLRVVIDEAIEEVEPLLSLKGDHIAGLAKYRDMLLRFKAALPGIHAILLSASFGYLLTDHNEIYEGFIKALRMEEPKEGGSPIPEPAQPERTPLQILAGKVCPCGAPIPEQNLKADIPWCLDCADAMEGSA